MPYLSDTQRNLLAPAVRPPDPRNGLPVPTSNQNPFKRAACWGWALTGEYESTDNAYTAPTVYSSDNGAFVFGAQRRLTGLNANFFGSTDLVFPQTIPYHQVLTTDFNAALAGNRGAQDRCRVALMKLIATLNGHTVLPDDGSDRYTMVMNTNSWYGWDHWGIGIRGAVVTYQQKVTDTPLQYNCNVMWDESQPLVTTLKLDGLLAPQIAMLNNVV